MSPTQRVVVRKEGGCGGFLAFLLVFGMVVLAVRDYWYITLPVVLALGGLWWSARRRTVAAAGGPAAGATAAAGWFPDPHGRHEVRYWDGAQWTENIMNGGQPGRDPV